MVNLPAEDKQQRSHDHGDGSRFDLTTAVLHTGIYMVCIGTVALQAISCLTIVGTRGSRITTSGVTADPASEPRP